MVSSKCFFPGPCKISTRRSTLTLLCRTRDRPPTAGNFYYFLVDPISKHTPVGHDGFNAQISGGGGHWTQSQTPTAIFGNGPPPTHGPGDRGSERFTFPYNICRLGDFNELHLVCKNKPPNAGEIAWDGARNRAARPHLSAPPVQCTREASECLCRDDKGRYVFTPSIVCFLWECDGRATCQCPLQGETDVIILYVSVGLNLWSVW